VPEYLQLTIDHTAGPFSLRVACSFSAPWTLVFGPSGSGKTSLLRVIAGFLRPNAGRVLLNGKALFETETRVWVPPGQRSVGFVTQRPTLFPHMNVIDNVSFGFAAISGAEKKARAAQLLSLVEAEELGKRMPLALSGGERQRVAVARALAPEPQLLLLDEPFSGMDADLKARLIGRLTSWLGERDIPALYVSHDVAEAFQVASEVVTMEGGRIMAQGVASEVLAVRRDQLLRQLGVQEADVSRDG